VELHFYGKIQPAGKNTKFTVEMVNLDAVSVGLRRVLIRLSVSKLMDAGEASGLLIVCVDKKKIFCF